MANEYAIEQAKAQIAAIEGALVHTDKDLRHYYDSIELLEKEKIELKEKLFAMQLAIVILEEAQKDA